MITPRHTPEGALARVRQETCTGAFPAAAIVVAKPDDSPGAISREKGEDGAATRWTLARRRSKGLTAALENAGSPRSDFRGRRSAPNQKKAVPSFFRSPKQQKSKPVPAHTLKCDRTVRRRKAREWEITRVRATAPLGGGGTG